MERGFDEHAPEIDPETRREIFEDLKVKLIDTLEKQPTVRGSWFFGFGLNVELFSKLISAGSGANYKFTRNTNVEETEITIDRSGKRIDNPNIVLESIRFKFGRFGLRGQDPLIEYHRTLKEGGARTLKNSLPAIQRTERFIGEMSNELKPQGS